MTPLDAAYAALHADPLKIAHRVKKGRGEHLCIGTGCEVWISDALPSVLCPGCVITVRRSRGMQGDGTLA